jgi:DNA-binding response OmpR family regulator
LSLDTAAKRVQYSGKDVLLTAKEYSVLEYLMLNKNGVVTREMVEEHIWGSGNNAFSNVVEVLISRIRKKLDEEDKETVIKTVKGLGYTIRDEKS